MPEKINYCGDCGWRGPAGLTAAITLASGGIDTVLAGKRPERPDNRTSFLVAGSVTALATLGVWPLCEARAAPLKTMRIVDDTGRLWRAPEVKFEAQEIDLDLLRLQHRNTGIWLPRSSNSPERLATCALSMTKQRRSNLAAMPSPSRSKAAALWSLRSPSAPMDGVRSAVPPPASASTSATTPRSRSRSRSGIRARTATLRPNSTLPAAPSRWCPCPASGRAWSGPRPVAPPTRSQPSTTPNWRWRSSAPRTRSSARSSLNRDAACFR